MENNACDNNRIAKGLYKNKFFVEFYQNLSNGETKKIPGSKARRLMCIVNAAEKEGGLPLQPADWGPHEVKYGAIIRPGMPHSGTFSGDRADEKY